MGEQDGNPKQAEPTALESYQSNNRSPLKLIALVTLLLLAGALSVVGLAEGSMTRALAIDWVREYSTRWLYERHVFVLYACAFVAWWLVYLASRKPSPPWPDWSFRRARTLRRLLGECSEQWCATEQMTPEKLDELETRFRSKAQSSMTTIAILIAVSALELQEVSKLLAPLLETEFALSWEVVVLVLSLTFAMVSFIAYIVSADALDVIFNRFVDDDARHRITRYYYQGTINPRYAALISLIASFILLVAYYSPLAGAVAIGLFFVIGYAHWFPSFARVPASMLRRVSELLARAALVLAPLLPMLLGWRC